MPIRLAVPLSANLAFYLFLAAVLIPPSAAPGRETTKPSVSNREVIEEGVLFWSETYHTTSGPLELKILQIDMSQPGFKLFAQPGSGRLFTGQRPDEVDKRLRSEGRNVIASINADFWASSEPGRFYRPIGLHVSDGILATTTSRRSALLVDDIGRIAIKTVSLGVKARVGGESIPVADLNNTYTTSGLMLFTGPLGAPVPAYTTRSLVLVDLTEPGPRINRKAKGVVKNVLTTGTAIPTSVSVLLAYNQDVPNATPSAGAEVVIDCSLDNHDGSVAQAVGGGPRLVHRGRNSVNRDWSREGVGREFTKLRHPRTAIGFSRSQQTLWWVVADGRQPGYSVGINLSDLADHLVRLGADEAINLDGGGSSCMVVGGKIVNKPSDQTGTRPVCNTFHLVRK
jgi:hypothetical protein